MLGIADTLHPPGDYKLVKHNIREQLRSQLITMLIARRPRQFASMHYHANRRLINANFASFPSELEHSVLHTPLTGALWTAVQAYQGVLIALPLCPSCKAADETEEHIPSDCTAWSHTRDTRTQQVHALVAKMPELPPTPSWYPPPPASKSAALPRMSQPPLTSKWSSMTCRLFWHCTPCTFHCWQPGKYWITTCPTFF